MFLNGNKLIQNNKKMDRELMIVNNVEINEKNPTVKESDELFIWKSAAQRLALEMENQVRLFPVYTMGCLRG